MKTGPKTIYGDGEVGQKFVDPNPGQLNEEVVICNDAQGLTLNSSLVALQNLFFDQDWSQDHL